MRLRIESDGTAAGTKVLTESGEQVGGVQVLRLKVDNATGLVKASLEVVGVGLSYLGSVRVKDARGNDLEKAPEPKP